MINKTKEFLRILLITGIYLSVLGSGNTPETCSDMQKIISLSPSITEELYLLGVQDRIAGVTVYCARPGQAMEKEKVGSATNVNTEKIFSLQPDLVLASSLINQKNIEKLKFLGIRVEIFPSPENFRALCMQFLDLAKLVGRENLAENIIKGVTDRISKVKNSVKYLQKPGVIVQAGVRPLWIAPKNSFINDFIEFAGGKNLGPSGTNGRITREKAVILNPDVIIITTMGIVGEDEKTIWQKYKTISAVKKKRIYIMGNEKMCSSSPITFAATLEEIKALIH